MNSKAINKLSLSFLVITFWYDDQIHDDRQKSDFTTEIVNIYNKYNNIRKRLNWDHYQKSMKKMEEIWESSFY